ncbi:MAG: bifunctional phosphopantothenoylcysteine decarboxylase/phosphopantothenate--cysteine ligase CoaBC [Deltaproteobacteria bacterium]|nr:MAG: bifunctional phosphopantothenoylcysteine decarboxylase/phosphopantothenate--cysteine ligase CoaBC [Deltaproteobacteria bacterium]PIE74919.1 MAG: bifunctional phosphopantothenoylcysteine decarboxylase/phosphopantothenate--cysteine ligase CoaBC [Deltaproteobacteria bacterium]
MSSLQGKNIILGVTGGISAYKSVEILRLFQERGADVKVVMTENALKFVGSLTFQAISGHSVYSDVMSEENPGKINHIDIAAKADAMVVAPTTANFIGKIASGIADDALSTLFMAVRAPVLVCPAMNSWMYESRAVQRNLDIISGDGVNILQPDEGFLACGVSGSGRLPAPFFITEKMESILSRKDFEGKKILVTAGPTVEPIDPVRYLSNHSSGKMGYAIAEAFRNRGGEVVIVSGPVSINPPFDIEVVKIKTASEMLEECVKRIDSADIVVKVAAVADYRVKNISAHKIKKSGEIPVIELEENPDIIKTLGSLKKESQIFVGFAAETQELENNALEKLESKNLDMIVANKISGENTAFGSEKNMVSIFTKEGKKEAFDMMDKKDIAEIILDRIANL